MERLSDERLTKHQNYSLTVAEYGRDSGRNYSDLVIIELLMRMNEKLDHLNALLERQSPKPAEPIEDRFTEVWGLKGQESPCL